MSDTEQIKAVTATLSSRDLLVLMQSEARQITELVACGTRLTAPAANLIAERADRLVELSNLFASIIKQPPSEQMPF